MNVFRVQIKLKLLEITPVGFQRIHGQPRLDAKIVHVSLNEAVHRRGHTVGHLRHPGPSKTFVGRSCATIMKKA
jgi:hypothetical protein